ncbi:MAG: hypothetical protein S4CHLAM20_00910 [Chlamydiia bacterium]|nr:hypothetical protein [Chlamydiia bacterium]
MDYLYYALAALLIISLFVCFSKKNNKKQSAETKDSSSGYYDDSTCDKVSFKIENGKIYMCTSTNCGSDDFQFISHASGDISQGVFPPTNWQIQQVFPTYGFLTSGSDTKENDAAFTAHSGFASQGDGQVFQLCNSSNSAKVFFAYFKVSNGKYYMSLTDDDSSMQLIGSVSADILGVHPPAINLIQDKFPNIWYASGTKELNKRIDLFHDHSGFASNGDGQIFNVHVFKGPY